MGFDIKINDEVIHSVDIDPRLVTGVKIFTPTGEVAAAGFSMQQNSINIQLDYQVPDSLEVMEDDARLAKAAAAEENPEPLYHNVNAQRIEELNDLAKEQADRSNESSEDLAVQNSEERRAITESPVNEPVPEFVEPVQGSTKKSTPKSKTKVKSTT